MTPAEPLPICQAVADAIDFLKSYRELDSEKSVSLTIKGKKFNKMRVNFGSQFQGKSFRQGAHHKSQDPERQTNLVHSPGYTQG